MFGKSNIAERVEEILAKHHGGIYKRIDENCELLELLQREAPDLLAKHLWIVGWLEAQDGFLRDLAAAMPPADAQFPFMTSESGRGFPRPWPLINATQTMADFERKSD